MAKGISIHIGLNFVDPNAYGGWDGRLAGCENDARDLLPIVNAQGYSSTLILNEQATSNKVITEIGKAAKELSCGDILLLTYSGHGGQVPDDNGDEEDTKDETWVLYDRMLIDDELYQLWSQFQSGVRIFVLSDSCHSGTILKSMAFPGYRGLEEEVTFEEVYEKYYTIPSEVLQPKGPITASILYNLYIAKSLDSPKVDFGPEKEIGGSEGTRAHNVLRFRAIPYLKQKKVYESQKEMYEAREWAAVLGKNASIGASIILISGCQDNQLSMDGARNGLFTETLLRVWDNGNFQGNYNKFWRDIQQRMPSTQTPNYFKVGTDNPSFENERPFTIGSIALVTYPSVQGPESISRIPTFQVNTAGAPYYIFEITSRPELFNYTDLSSLDFYGSWQEGKLFPSSKVTYELPSDVWDRLKGVIRLYYRIGTTTSQTGWDNYKISDQNETEIR